MNIYWLFLPPEERVVCSERLRTSSRGCINFTASFVLCLLCNRPVAPSSDHIVTWFKVPDQPVETSHRLASSFSPEFQKLGKKFSPHFMETRRMLSASAAEVCVSSPVQWNQVELHWRRATNTRHKQTLEKLNSNVSLQKNHNLREQRFSRLRL